MSFESVKSTYLPQVEEFLETFLQDMSQTTGATSAEMTSYQLQTGGKRLRALIPAMVYEAVGRDRDEFSVAVAIGAAVEMVHNATLVHDDLQDGDELRRNLPTVWKKYSDAQAINCGDAMFQYAFQMLTRSGVDPEVFMRLVDRFSNATTRVIEGQAQEFRMKDESYPGVERYFEVIRGKTSGLFGLPIVAAMESLSIESRYCDLVESAASDLGMVFQIQDDILDIYGKKGRDRIATDVAEGKISVFVAHVNEVGSQEDKSRLNKILHKARTSTTDADIQEAIEIFERYDAKGMALGTIRTLLAKIGGKEESAYLGLQVEPQLKGIRQMLIDLGDVFLEPLNGIV